MMDGMNGSFSWIINIYCRSFFFLIIERNIIEIPDYGKFVLWEI